MDEQVFPGVDIIEISRFKQAAVRNPRILDRLFTKRELAKIKADNFASLAARFAGKEAVLKTLGTGLNGLSWHDIEIIGNDLGEPVVYLSDRAREAAGVRGGQSVRISLSHSRDNAIAVAILI